MIFFQDVAIGYIINKQRNIIFNNLNSSLKPGINAVIGPSGSGKSTFLMCLLKLKEVWHGNIKFSKKFNISYISQENELIDNLTVFENVYWQALTKHTPQEAKENTIKLLNRLNIYCLEKRADCLSGGQKQRVALARGLVTNPDLIIADEITSQLDEKTANLTINLISEVAKDRLVVIATHDQRIMDIADNIINLSKV